MKCTVYYNDSFENPTPNKMTFFDTLYFDYKVVEDGNTSRLNLYVHPKEKITLSKVVLEIPYNFQTQDRVFGNGFQSCSHSKMFGIHEEVPQIMGIAKRYFQYYGDEHLFNDKKPSLYSWTYGYVQRGGQYYFVGSTSETTAFSYIEYDVTSNLIKVIKLCDDIELSHSFPVFEIIVCQGTEKFVFDTYFNETPKFDETTKSTIGWTYSNRYFNDKSVDQIAKDLGSFSALSDMSPISDNERVFQIGDGYQKTIGDWLDPNANFSEGVSQWPQKIKAKNIVPGIWIAPFICSKSSKIYNQQKDWLLKDKNGQLLKVGYKKEWGGWYFALDIYHAKVRDYLTEVFFTLTNKWGFEIINTDLLFAAMLAPPRDKTKAQVMHDAMSFLEQLIGKRRLFVGGVPLGSAFHKATYCRIAPNIHLAWDHKLLKFFRFRERTSSLNALRTIINRRQLNKRIFLNDPGEFTIREQKHQLGSNKEYTKLLIQVLFGSRITSTDDWEQYDEHAINEIKGLIQLLDSQILGVQEPSTDYYQVSFKKERHFVAHINLNDSKLIVSGLKDSFELDPFESLVLKKD